jgi:peptidoglycan hydrolase-like protein with peptidoglycan-binding domain
MKKRILLIALGIISIPSLCFASIDTNLKYGSVGQQVIELQEFLIDKGFLQTQATGNFYSLTLKAVKAFQSANHISPTGYVGILTRAKINNEINAETASSTTEQLSNTNTTPVVNKTNAVVVQPQPQNTISNTVINTPIVQNNIPTDYSSFQKIKLSQYANNSSAYSGQNISIVGSVTSFLSRGSDGDSNYITLFDPIANVQVMLKISNDSTYSTLVNKVNAGDTFKAYGVGVASKTFINSYGIQIIQPIVQLYAADNCDGYSSVTNLTSDGSPYGWTCEGTMQHVMPL